MNTELFIVHEAAALTAVPVALTMSPMLGGMCRNKILMLGHLTAFFFALMGSLTAMSQSIVTPVIVGHGFLTLRLDIATSLLLTAMALISAVVVAFSERYLGGDSNREKFLGSLSFLSSCAVWLAVTDNMVTAFVCWHLLSVGLWRTVALHAESRSKSTILMHQIFSDAALLLALVLVIESTGVIQFSRLPEVLPSLNSNLELFGFSLPVSAGIVASVLLVLSFSIKSALFPFHRWLLATLDAPTPLSGLLHAGVVNVSAIVAWRMMPVLEANASVLLAWGAFAILSALVGTLCMSAQPDVKRKLVYSTVGQMGFMCLQCASGAIGAALFHLIAHGLFKCHLFLQSGSAVAEGLEKRKFAYSGERQPMGDLRTKAFLFASTLIFGTVYLALHLNSGWSNLTAVIAGTAVLSTVPALNRINIKSVFLFWSVILAFALISAIGIGSFENLIHFVAPMNVPLLSLASILFVIVAVCLYYGREAGFARAVYVHCLSGFYIDEIALAFGSRLKPTRNSLYFTGSGGRNEGYKDRSGT